MTLARESEDSWGERQGAVALEPGQTFCSVCGSVGEQDRFVQCAYSGCWRELCPRCRLATRDPACEEEYVCGPAHEVALYEEAVVEAERAYREEADRYGKLIEQARQEA